MDAVAGRTQLKPADPVRLSRILNVDDVIADTVVDGVNVILINEDIVDATGQLVIVLR